MTGCLAHKILTDCMGSHGAGHGMACRHGMRYHVSHALAQRSAAPGVGRRASNSRCAHDLLWSAGQAKHESELRCAESCSDRASQSAAVRNLNHATPATYLL